MGLLDSWKAQVCGVTHFLLYVFFCSQIILQLGILVISIVVALAVALLVEMPLSNLEVLLSYYVELIRSKMLNTSI